jgi:uncharacterized membrane-anchored protein
MRKKTSLFFYGLLIAQLLFLLLIAASYYGVDWVGKEVRLRTAPVDPRDIFYGDFVYLNYEISTLSMELWKGEEAPEHGDTVFVVLRREGSTHEAVAVYPKKPPIQKGEIILKGKLQRWFSPQNQLGIVYGFERYYVPENTGRHIEEQWENIVVVVKVAPWGQAKIDRLEFEEK